MNFISSYAAALRKVLPSPHSPFAYVTATIIAVALAPLPVLLLFGLIMMNWWEASGYFAALLLVAAAILVCTCLYNIVSLTIQRQWSTVIGWWLDLFAQRTDWLRSYSTNMRVVRQRFGADEAIDDGAGFFLTMAPEQRFPKRAATKIQYTDDRHVTLIAGSRAGKGRSVIIPSLAHHRGSVVCYDPAGELWKETAAYRRKVLGQRTILLDPFNVTGEKSDTWNPMSEISFYDDPFAVDKAGLIAESLQDMLGGDPYWTMATRKLLAMVMLYVGSRAIEEHNNLGQVRDLLMTGDVGALWKAMQRSDAFEGLIRRFGEANENRGERELASVLEVARTAMKFLDSRPMTEFVKRSTFKMRELKNGNTSIYIVLPAGMGEQYKSWLRLLFNAAFDAMQDQSIPKPEIPTLLVLDEFALLGRMERIHKAAGESAKFGIKMLFCLQSLGQLKENYGPYSYEDFCANSGAIIAFGNNDLETQQYISARLGREYYKAYSHSSSSGPGGGSSSTSYSIQLRDVARADQVEKLASRQSGEAFIFIQGAKPMRLPRANYDEWMMLETEPLKTKVPEPVTKPAPRRESLPDPQEAALAAFKPQQ